MQPEDRKKFLTVLAGVHDFFGKELSPFAAQVWLQACEAYEVEQVTKALSAHLMDPERGQWLPKPADIVRQLEGSFTDRSLVAWGAVYQAMKDIGAYRSVDFGNPAIHQAIADMGGWTKICRADLSELPHIQRRFCESFRAYAKRGTFDAPKSLPGEFELANAKLGSETKVYQIKHAMRTSDLEKLGAA